MYRQSYFSLREVIQMPKKQIQYLCDICDAVHETEEAAIECEKSHWIPKSVDTPKYNIYDEKSQYPDSVVVRFERAGRKMAVTYFKRKKYITTP